MVRKQAIALLSGAGVLFTIFIGLSFAALPSWIAGFIIEPLLRIGGREPSMATGVLLGGLLGAAISPMVQRGISQLKNSTDEKPSE